MNNDNDTKVMFILRDEKVVSTLTKVIQQGIANFRSLEPLNGRIPKTSIEECIHMSVSDFMWKSFHGVDLTNEDAVIAAIKRMAE